MNRYGKPLFRITIEDFSGSYELKLGGKDIDRFVPQLMLNSAVFIEGTIDKRFSRTPEEIKEKGNPPYTFKIRNVMQLGNVTETALKGFALKIATPQLNSDFRTNLVKVVKRHKGKTPLTVFLFDPGTKYNIEFMSKKFQVDVTNDFIADIRTMNIEYETIRR